MSNTTATPTATELTEVERANDSGKTPVVFVHGLWLLDSSWDRWATFFENAGYAAVTPGWPDDPTTVEEARKHPEVFAGKSIGDVAAYQQAIIDKLAKKPAIIGHSFGGVLVQILAGRGLSAATVAIDPAPSRGVLPLPISALKSSSGFANAVDEDEARQLYEEFHVAGSGIPLFQAAFANINPRTEAKADKKNPDRGPMLIVSGELDHQVPWAIANATYKQQQKNEHAVTEIVEIAGRGHSLTIDSGWEEVAKTSLDFIQRFVR
jgi:non-heme chloroperoxidase